MEISFPTTGLFPARAEPKAETPLTTVIRDDATGWWDKFQADIPHINPADVVSLQCRVIDGKLVHVGALVESGSGAIWLTAPDGFGARPAPLESGYPLPPSVRLANIDAAAPPPDPSTLVALCDGSIARIKFGDSQEIMHANSAAADRLVERIAKRVVEMQGKVGLASGGLLGPIIGRMVRPEGAGLVYVGESGGEVQAGKRLPPIAGQKVTDSVDIYAWDAPVEPATT